MMKDYKDFLQDENFIMWQLTGDELLQNYWQEYVAKYPDQKEELNKAINAFQKIRLNKEHLTSYEKQQLLGRLHSSYAERAKCQ